MSCPSLLTCTVRKNAPVFSSETVFTDLMLRDVFSEDVIRVLSRGADAGEIAARQDVFRALENDPSMAERFSAMSSSTANLARLLRRYDDLHDSTGAVMIFTHLAKEFLRFLDLAEFPSPRGRLLTEFSAYIHNLKIHPLTEEMRRLCADIPDFSGRTLRIRTVDGSLQMTAVTGNAAAAHFEANLTAMGLPPTPDRQRSPRQMPASFSDGLAKLYPTEYAAAQVLHDRCAPYLFGEEADIRALPALSREIGFYAAIHKFTQQMREEGFPMNLPQVCESRRICLRGVRDISLRRRGLRGEDVVPNDLMLTAEGGDNFFWLTGANGGGKTVFLRAAGIAVLLAQNGCPVPCDGGDTACFTRLMTHFPLNEDFSGTGRFDEEMQRAEAIMTEATPESVILLNETFSGTDEVKSAASSRMLAETLYSRGAFGIYVTHLHELTGSTIPSLAAVIDESSGNRRTYRIIRAPRTDSSHAADILYKYSLTRGQLAERRKHLEKP